MTDYVDRMMIKIEDSKQMVELNFVEIEAIIDAFELLRKDYEEKGFNIEESFCEMMLEKFKRLL